MGPDEVLSVYNSIRDSEPPRCVDRRAILNTDPEDVWGSKGANLKRESCRVQLGTSTVGKAAGRVKQSKVRFEEGRFEAPPKVAILAARDPCCGDEFEFAAL